MKTLKLKAAKGSSALRSTRSRVRAKIRSNSEDTASDDLYGERCAVFAKSKPADSLSPESLAFLDEIDAQQFEIPDIDDEHGSLALGYGRYHALVVRPDRYVFGVAVEASALDPLILELKQQLG